MVIPARISDVTLQYAARYRSKARVPALAYLHWANTGSITRCAQPLPGLKQARSVQDEKVVEAIFTSHLYADSNSSSMGANGPQNPHNAVYGATSTNVIIDARPTTNAVATYARGGGTENMDHYKGCRKAYMGIENIHVMRDSINRVVDALRAADEPITFGLNLTADVTTTDEQSRQSRSGEAVKSSQLDVPSQERNRSAQGSPRLDVGALKRSNWLKHTACLLDGTAIIVRNVHVASSHALIHCSDGWDRTSQLSALAQICLDPYYRTMRGFAVLVEKDWVSFGHRFADRCGHGGSHKYFVNSASEVEPDTNEEEPEEAEAAVTGATTAAGGGGASAAASAFWGFTKQITANFGGGGSASGALAAGPGAHVKETSPVFTQFLDCIWQMMRQFPSRFEFNEEWLSTLHRELYECRFGTFLANSERERKRVAFPESSRAPIAESTPSIWDLMLAEDQRQRFLNPNFEPSLDEPKRADADMGVLFVKGSDVRWCTALFGSRMEEANRALAFEESERQRRKAEKQRWEEERLARKEEEEKRRREELMEGSSQRGSRVDGGAVDLMTASGLERDNGGANGDTRTGALGYQARARPPKPRAGSQQRSNQAPQEALRNEGSGASPGSDAYNPTPPATEAAARFRTWAMGGWDRFQEVVAGGGTGVEAADHQQRAAPRREMEEDNPWSSDAATSNAQHPAGDHWGEPSASHQQRAAVSNPWRSAGTEDQVAHPSSQKAWTAQSNGLSGSLDRLGLDDDSRGARSSSPAAAAGRPSSTSRSQTSVTSAQTEAPAPPSSKPPASDPLGVGPL